MKATNLPKHIQQALYLENIKIIKNKINKKNVFYILHNLHACKLRILTYDAKS